MLRRSTSPYFCAFISTLPLKNLIKNYKQENNFANPSLSMLKSLVGIEENKSIASFLLHAIAISFERFSNGANPCFTVFFIVCLKPRFIGRKKFHFAVVPQSLL